MSSQSVYERQGFGQGLELEGNVGRLIVDFVNGFADRRACGGRNILEAIEQTRTVLADARAQNWPVPHSRIVFAADSADRNVFGLKVLGLVQLREHNPASAIVDALKPAPGELVVRKTVPSAFFGTALAAWFAERAVQ